MKISIDLDIEASEIPLATELLNTLRCTSRVSVKLVNSAMSFPHMLTAWLSSLRQPISSILHGKNTETVQVLIGLTTRRVQVLDGAHSCQAASGKWACAKRHVAFP